MSSPLEIWFACAYKSLALGQIEELGHQFAEENVLLEPVGGNTLPAIFYGVQEIVRRHGDDLVMVFLLIKGRFWPKLN